MIPKFVIPLLYVFVLVHTDDDQELDTNAINKIASGNIATILEPEFTTNKKSETKDEKVKIQLYYETLCPFCIYFSSPFVKTVTELWVYLEVHVYPYGNAQVDENGNIICQHGPEECYGNKLHACAIDQFPNMTDALIFNGCMMADGRCSDDAAADECASNYQVESEPIKQCAKGPRGEELLKFYGSESKKYNYEGVPTVLINGIVGNTQNFKNDVCDSFKTPPPPCRP